MARSLGIDSAWIAGVVVMLGTLGWIESSTGTGRGLVELQGEFWAAHLGDGEALRVRARKTGVIFPAGGTVDFTLQDTDSTRLQSLGAEWTPLIATSSLEVVMREGPTGSSVIRVIPGSPAFAIAGRRDADGRDVVLERARLGAGPTMGQPSRLRVTLDGPRFLLAIDGRDALTWDDVEATGSRASLRATGGGVTVTHLRATTMGTSGPAEMRDDLDRLPAVSRWPGRLENTLLAGCVLATVALWLALLFALARSQWMSLRDTLAVTAFALCLPTLPSALRFVGVDIAPSPSALPLLVIFGVAIAGVFILARSSGRTQPESLTTRRLVVVGAALTLATLAVGHERSTQLAPRLAAEHASWNTVPPRPFRLSAARQLHALNALEAKGEWRDFDLIARVTMPADAVCEWRVRAHGETAWSLCLSTRPDVPTRWIEQDTMRFAPRHADLGTLARDTEFELVIEARGRQLTALVGGRELVVADAVGAGGDIVALAVDGRTSVSSCDIRARQAGEYPGVADAWAAREVWRAVAVPWGVLVAWVVVALVTTRQRPLALAAPAACALLPCALVFLVDDAPSGRPWVSLTNLGGLTAIALATTGVLAARGRLVTSALLVVTSVACAAALVLGTARIARHVDLTPPAATSLLAWRGERVAPGLAHWQVPLLRHLNEALVAHRFRGRVHPAETPAQTFRVVALGGSVTYGFHIPRKNDAAFPAVLERLLGSERTDVINAAWRGATGARLLRMLRDGLADVDIDAVVLCLTYNDAYALSRVDEHAMLAQLEAHAEEQASSRLATMWHGLRMSLDYRSGIRDLAGLLYTSSLTDSSPTDNADTSVLWNDLNLQAGSPTPPERFAAVINAFVEEAHRRGVPLVLVAEPLAGDDPLIWKDEFHAVLAEAALADGVSYVDPTPALQHAGGARLFLDKVHPNIEGHAVIARQIAPVLESLRD